MVFNDDCGGGEHSPVTVRVGEVVVTVDDERHVVRAFNTRTGRTREDRGQLCGGLACYPYADAVTLARRMSYARRVSARGGVGAAMAGNGVVRGGAL